MNEKLAAYAKNDEEVVMDTWRRYMDLFRPNNELKRHHVPMRRRRSLMGHFIKEARNGR